MVRVKYIFPSVSLNLDTSFSNFISQHWHLCNRSSFKYEICFITIIIYKQKIEKPTAWFTIWLWAAVQPFFPQLFCYDSFRNKGMDFIYIYIYINPLLILTAPIQIRYIIIFKSKSAINPHLMLMRDVERLINGSSTKTQLLSDSENNGSPHKNSSIIK